MPDIYNIILFRYFFPEEVNYRPQHVQKPKRVIFKHAKEELPEPRGDH